MVGILRRVSDQDSPWTTPSGTPSTSLQALLSPWEPSVLGVSCPPLLTRFPGSGPWWLF